MQSNKVYVRILKVNENEKIDKNSISYFYVLL